MKRYAPPDSPEQLLTPVALRSYADEAWRAGRRLGLVPTMGNLHAGHMALVQHAQRHGCGPVVLSIFVNPLQFGAGEDLQRYPRTLEQDLVRCRAAGVDAVFLPTVEQMFPSGCQTEVQVPQLAAGLEGGDRPGHFRGVATVVAKLFQLAAPCVAVFGRKDYQQWRIIARMVEDLAMPVQVEAHATVREADGLALSSRNQYLDAEQRQRATALYQALRAASQSWQAGERRTEVLRQSALRVLAAGVDRVGYVELVDADGLQPLADRAADRALLALAAFVGTTRLIDNVVLGEDTLL